MELVVGLVARLLIGGLLLWGSIKVVDRHNQQNSFGAAVGWSLMLSLAGVLPLFGPILGLIVFFMVCFRYYDLGVLQTLGVILVQIGIAVGVGILVGGMTAGAR